MSSQEEVLLFPAWLRVRLGDDVADFHYRWLRHACDRDRHPTTNERTVCSSELPNDLSVVRATMADDELRVVWMHDGRESVFTKGWLQQHAYALNRPGFARAPNDVSRIEIDGAELSLDTIVERALSVVAERGAVIVRRPGGLTSKPEAATDTIIEAVRRSGLSVIETHFGRIEDLRTDNTTNQNTDQLGYTDAAVNLHTDQPFLDTPPRYQMLHSIRMADRGGENALVDGSRAAELLASLDRSAYALLRDTPVTFHRKQKSFESVVRAPIFGESDGRFHIRYSYFTLAPHALPFDAMEPFYAAYDKFARLVRDPENQIRFLLSPGDFLLYDNHRMLHARTSFSGPRWMRGVYFDPA